MAGSCLQVDTRAAPCWVLRSRILHSCEYFFALRKDLLRRRLCVPHRHAPLGHPGSQNPSNRTGFLAPFQISRLEIPLFGRRLVFDPGGADVGNGAITEALVEVVELFVGVRAGKNPECGGLGHGGGSRVAGVFLFLDIRSAWVWGAGWIGFCVLW